VNVLEEWLTEASARLGLDEGTGAAYRDLVLDLARDVAHGVARPAAPLTTFLLGLAAGRAGGAAQDVTRLSAELSTAVELWAKQHPGQG
jgi:hypothetical protein